MALLPGGARISLLHEGMDERQVVSLDGKQCPFKKMSKVMYAGMHCEKFSVEGGVSSFHRGEFSAEKCELLPGTMEDLFKDCANGGVAGIGGKH